jgi:flagellar hook-associated protein 3 FlgL
MIYDGIAQNLSRKAGRVMKAHTSISSGKRINDPSDDPLAMTRILNYRTKLASIDQYTENIDQGTSWLKATESSIYEVNKQLSRTKELVLSQVSGPASGASRQATAEEVTEIFEHLIQLANARLGERFLFSGFKTDTAPFLSTLDYTYQGDTGTIQIEIAQNQKASINLNGAEIFTSGPVNIFQTLDDIVTDLNNDDVSGLQGDIDALNSSISHVLAKLGEVGAKTNQLESTKTTLIDLNLNVSEMLSELEDADLAKAISELAFYETAYQASLASSARLMQTNLLEFLR